MKATIKRVRDEKGNYYFRVYSDDSYVTCFSFRPNEPKGSVYNEQTNFLAAKEMAEKIEAGENVPFEETIYETPEKPQL